MSEEPTTRSFHLPYLPSESTLSRISLFLEATPTGFFAGVYIIASHKNAVVLYCFRHMPALQKYFSNGRTERASVCFRGKFNPPPPPTYLSSKNKKIRDRVDSRVQLVWRLQVMGSCSSIYNSTTTSKVICRSLRDDGKATTDWDRPLSE